MWGYPRVGERVLSPVFGEKRYVYLGSPYNRKDVFKIGISNNPRGRMSSLSKHLGPSSVFTFDFGPVLSQRVERFFLRKLSNYQMKEDFVGGSEIFDSSCYQYVRENLHHLFDAAVETDLPERLKEHDELAAERKLTFEFSMALGIGTQEQKDFDAKVHWPVVKACVALESYAQTRIDNIMDGMFHRDPLAFI